VNSTEGMALPEKLHWLADHWDDELEFRHDESWFLLSDNGSIIKTLTDFRTKLEDTNEKSTVILEVVSGPEGNALYITDDSTGYRLAGPKPWGGGTVLHSFKVKCDELLREIDSFKKGGG